MQDRAGRGLSVRARKIDPHRRALADLALDARVATRLLGKSVNLAETQTGAFANLLCRVKRLERSFQHLGGHPASGIGDREHNIIAGGLIDLVVGCRQIFGAKAKTARSAHCIARVRGKVQYGGAELRGIDPTGPNLVLQRERDFDALADRLLTQYPVFA